MPANNTHNEELQDVMGRIPGWVIRWGISVIFIILALVVTLSYFVKYPEIVTAPVVLTTENPPADLMAKSTGKIERLFVSEGELVAVNTPVAMLFNTANYEDIISLNVQLQSHGINWDSYIDEGFTKRLFNAGELQSFVSQFMQICKSYGQYVEMGNIPKKRAILKAQVDRQKINYVNLQKQKELLDKEFAMDAEFLKADSTLYYGKTISREEYYRTIQSNLQKQGSLIGQESALAQTEANILNTEGQIVELDIQYQNDLNDFSIQLGSARDQLLAQLKQWFDRYLITSPIDGRMTFTKYWSENQSVISGERFATVIPADSMLVIGKMYIPSASFGKVKVGQRVDVKLNAYPFMEFGVLRGELVSISAVPEKEGYIAEIQFPGGLISTYKQELQFIQQMDGTGEIVTKDLRLIERFLQPVKHLLRNNF